MTKDELREMLAGAIYVRFAGGASGDADDMAATLSLGFADAVFAALHDAGLAIVPRAIPEERLEEGKFGIALDCSGMDDDVMWFVDTGSLREWWVSTLSAGDLLGERGS